MSDITDRLDALEAALAGNQLPNTLAILQRKLEQTWQPDASILLQPGSITPELIASAFNIGPAASSMRFGTQTLAFTASTNSAAATVTHGLDKTPSVIVAAALNASFGNIPNPDFNTVGATTFDMLGEVKTSFTGSVTMMWIALG